MKLNPFSTHEQAINARRYAEAVRWHNAVRAQTTDSPRRNRDTIISAVELGSSEERAAAARTAEVFGADMGKRWTGDLKPAGEALAEFMDALVKVRSRDGMRDALSKAMVDIAQFGGALEAGYGEEGPNDSVVFDEQRGGREEDITGHKVRTGDSARARLSLRDDGTKRAVTPEEINTLNRKFWNDHDSATAARDGAGRRGLSTRATPESINRANKTFWDRVLGK